MKIVMTTIVILFLLHAADKVDDLLPLLVLSLTRRRLPVPDTLTERFRREGRTRAPINQAYTVDYLQQAIALDEAVWSQMTVGDRRLISKW